MKSDTFVTCSHKFVLNHELGLMTIKYRVGTMKRERTVRIIDIVSGNQLSQDGRTGVYDSAGDRTIYYANLELE